MYILFIKPQRSISRSQLGQRRDQGAAQLGGLRPGLEPGALAGAGPYPTGPGSLETATGLADWAVGPGDLGIWGSGDLGTWDLGVG